MLLLLAIKRGCSKLDTVNNLFLQQVDRSFNLWEDLIDHILLKVNFWLQAISAFRATDYSNIFLETFLSKRERYSLAVYCLSLVFHCLVYVKCFTLALYHVISLRALTQINSQSDLISMSSFASPSYFTIRSSVYMILI